MQIIAALLCAAAIFGVLFMIYRYIKHVRAAGRGSLRSQPARSPLGAEPSRPATRRRDDFVAASRALRFPAIHRLTRRDALLALGITLVYAAVAFLNLGSATAPQTFYRFTSDSPALIIDLGDTYNLSGFTYYTGSYHDRSADKHQGYYIELSADGSDFTPFGILEQTHAYTFHWMQREFTLDDVDEFQFVPSARYIRLYAQSFPLELGELFVLDHDDSVIDPANYAVSTDDGATYTPLADLPAVDGDQLVDPTFDNPALLFDEQPLYAAEQTYMNSMYFDEIYHGRTAREYLLEENIYENTHPPLGKSIISLGIMLFGMTPFGWRFMGTLFGVLMVPFAYTFIKNLFGKTWLAVCGTLIFAFEFMHFTQTRIATIDTYGLFFTILMYFFMYRFLAAGYDAPARSRLVPLALCGISFGCGIASKWTCFYAAAGLVVLYVIGAFTEGRRLAAEQRLGEFLRKFGIVVAVSFVFFVGVAGAIYYLSYLPFAAGNGREMSLATVWQNQTTMFNYHSGLSATHGHQSSWWMWLLDVRPILYVFKSYADGTVSAFSAFNTPIVSWAGLAAVTALAASLYRGASRTTKLTGAAFAAIAAAAFAAQIVTYAVTYFAAEAQGLDLVEDVAYTHHPFSYVFAVAAVCAVVTPFASGHDSASRSALARLRPLLTPTLFILATGALFAMRLIGYDPESTSLVAATDTPTGYLTAAIVCIAIAAVTVCAAKAKAFATSRGASKPSGKPSAERIPSSNRATPHTHAPRDDVRAADIAHTRNEHPRADEPPCGNSPQSGEIDAAGPCRAGAVRRSPLRGDASSLDRRYHIARSLFLLVGYLAQLLAWIPITRNTFAYHYFPSSFFLILALCALFDRWSGLPKPTPSGKRTHAPKPTKNKLVLAWRAANSGTRAAVIFTAASLALFALFYPYLSGAFTTRDHLFTFLRWLPSWPM